MLVWADIICSISVKFIGHMVWPQMWSVLVNVSCELKKNILLFVGWGVEGCQYINNIQLSNGAVEFNCVFIDFSYLFISFGCPGFSSSCGEWGLLFVAGHGLLTVLASLVVGALAIGSGLRVRVIFCCQDLSINFLFIFLTYSWFTVLC